MTVLTPVDQALMQEVINNGGRANSLFNIACELDINYHHAHDRLTRLASLGCVCLSRQPGRPLNICCLCWVGGSCMPDEP